MNSTSKNNSNKEINLYQKLEVPDSEEKNSVDNFLGLILRRKKFFILSLIIFTSFSLIRTTREKIYNPVFKGEFSILISDPIKQRSANSFGTIGGVVAAQNFMGAATSDLEQDIPTLRELLLSELVLQDLSKKYKLNTICSSGSCPNMAECWGEGTATFMILGNICTRSCGFCGVKTGRPEGIDWSEPEKVAKSIQIMNIKHAVITSVDRDDLKDMGSIIWAETINAIIPLNPKTTHETFIPVLQVN